MRSQYKFLIMNTPDLLKLHKETCDKCYGVMQKKNNDYSGGATSSDALANFKMSSSLGLAPVMGLLLRIQDKMMRIKTFATDGELNVANETVNDAFEDIINYAVLGKALLQESRAEYIDCIKEPSLQDEESIQGVIKQFMDHISNGSDPTKKEATQSVPQEIILDAIGMFDEGFIYYGEITPFSVAVNQFASHLSSDDIDGNIQIFTAPKGDDPEGYILVAVKKGSLLYKALSKKGYTPTA